MKSLQQLQEIVLDFGHNPIILTIVILIAHWPAPDSVYVTARISLANPAESLPCQEGQRMYRFGMIWQALRLPPDRHLEKTDYYFPGILAPFPEEFTEDT